MALEQGKGTVPASLIMILLSLKTLSDFNCQIKTLVLPIAKSKPFVLSYKSGGPSVSVLQLSDRLSAPQAL